MNLLEPLKSVTSVWKRWIVILSVLRPKTERDSHIWQLELVIVTWFKWQLPVISSMGLTRFEIYNINKVATINNLYNLLSTMPKNTYIIHTLQQ